MPGSTLVNGANALVASGGGGATSTTITENGISKYAMAAIALFVIGMSLFVIMLLNTLSIINLSKESLVGGILNFCIAFGSMLCLIFSGSYTALVNAPSYHITSGTSTTVIGAATAMSIPLSTNPLFGPIITLFGIMAAVIGVISLFIFGFQLRDKRRKERKKKQDM